MNSESIAKQNVRVMCRFRPLSQNDRRKTREIDVKYYESNKTIDINPRSQDTRQAYSFTYDFCFQPNASQGYVYEHAAKPVVDSVLEGFNGTVFAYGQTASGKTHTIMGSNDSNNQGIAPRMLQALFGFIEDSDEHMEFAVKTAYLEIYLEKIRDLLNPKKKNLKIREDKMNGVYIDEITEEYVSEYSEVVAMMKAGNRNRETSATLMNEDSSRSHSIFMITLSQTNLRDYSSKTGKLCLVDLAGSEKVSKSGAAGLRLDEAKNINQSLSTLGKVIYNLTDGISNYIPYRDSKLTRILQDSLGGNSKTTLIITCSMSASNEAETLQTLRFGVRAKGMVNRPKVNRELTTAELKILLGKAEAQINERDDRIMALEDQVRELGGTVESWTPAPVKKLPDDTNVQELVNQINQLQDEIRKSSEKLQDTETELSFYKNPGENTENSEILIKKDAKIARLKEKLLNWTQDEIDQGPPDMNLFMDLQNMWEKNSNLESIISDLREQNDQLVENLQIQEFEAQNKIQKLKRKLSEYKMGQTTPMMSEPSTQKLKEKVQEYKDRMLGYEDRITDLETDMLSLTGQSWHVKTRPKIKKKIKGGGRIRIINTGSKPSRVGSANVRSPKMRKF